MISEKLEKEIHSYPVFYQKVWHAVSKIPKGQTRSYSWIAEQIGNAKAYRAVGNALNKNPFPVVIPCHRVIRKNKSIGGFSQGMRKKRRLLSDEGVF